MATKRIKKELNEFEKNAHSNLISIICDENDIYNWVATIMGPRNSPYESGIFFLNIKFPSDYPFKPPEIKFTTKIFHLNINKNGNICCDCHPLLNMNWSPAHTVVKVLEYVYKLLSNPDPNCMFNYNTTFNTDREKYDKVAKEWTIKYATMCAEEVNTCSTLENSATESNIESATENQNELVSTEEVNNTESIPENNVTGEAEDINNIASIPENNTEQPSVSTSSRQSTGLREIFINYYNNRLHFDFTFKIEFGNSYVPLKCHKLVMSMWSSFFSDKMFGENCESIEEMIISDVSLSAFELLIKYCYELINIENVNDVKLLVEVCQAAKRYTISSLERACIRAFSFIRPSVDDVAKLLDAAILLGLDTLKQRCFKILEDNTAEILSPTDMTSITPAIVDAVLDLKILSLKSEYDLLCRVFKWGKYIQEQEENQSLKDIIEPYLKKMNFLSLTPNQFGLLVNDNKQCFTDGEISAIFMNIVCPQSKALPPWCNNVIISRSYKLEDVET